MITRLKTIVTKCTDCYANLALERYLTETVGEGECVLYLWQNRHTIVIGKNQNAWLECRTTEFEKDGGHLSRRLSGGGAVYHDMGNLNFTFCVRTADYDLAKQQSVIVEACRQLGIPAEISGRNDILTGGRKFSGNSFYNHEGRSFHNGTLLLRADMEMLGRYLSPTKAKLQSKGVASVRSRVINLCELKPELTVETMEQALLAAFGKVYGLKTERIREEDLDAGYLEKLRGDFASWEWIYGKNIPFSFSCGARFSWGELTLQLAVTDGICREAAVWTDALDADFAEPLKQALTGCRFGIRELCERVRQTPACLNVAEDICGLLAEQDI